MNDTELRQAFSERLGWKSRGVGYFWISPNNGIDNQSEPPSPTSRADVHNALMEMSGKEWIIFVQTIDSEIPRGNRWHVIEDTLKTPLHTLVACFLEATKGRMKK